MKQSTVATATRNMHLFFTEEQQARLRRHARQVRKPMSQIVRDATISYLTFVEEEERLTTSAEQDLQERQAQKRKPRGIGIDPDGRERTTPSPTPPPIDIERFAIRIEAAPTPVERERLLNVAVEAIATLSLTREEAEARAKALDERLKKSAPKRAIPDGLDFDL